MEELRKIGYGGVVVESAEPTAGKEKESSPEKNQDILENVKKLEFLQAQEKEAKNEYKAIYEKLRVSEASLPKDRLPEEEVKNLEERKSKLSHDLASLRLQAKTVRLDNRDFFVQKGFIDIDALKHFVWRVFENKFGTMGKQPDLFRKNSNAERKITDAIKNYIGVNEVGEFIIESIEKKLLERKDFTGHAEASLEKSERAMSKEISRLKKSEKKIQ